MLKRVSIQNFKSLKNVELDLQKVNLLIGPNNSGKTNFLKALEYILKDNINQIEENFDRLIFAKDLTASIKMKFSFCDGTKEDLETIYDCQVRRNINITKTKKDLHISTGEPFLYQDSPELNTRIGKGNIYKPDPNKLDKPAPVGRGDFTVAADASNLIAFFDRIRDEYPGTFARIKADLAKCVPEFTEINFQNVESTDELIRQFGDKTFKRIGLTDSRQNTIYWADELSEGTLYFLSLLCIINQPNPPRLLLLEEPEKGIHPRRIWEVMKFIFQLAEEKDVQIIMTTHNEHVVNAFSSIPESVFVFDKDEETGATSVRNLQKDIIEPTDHINEELGLDKIDLTSNLGEYWMYGLIGGVPSNV